MPFENQLGLCLEDYSRVAVPACLRPPVAVRDGHYSVRQLQWLQAVQASLKDGIEDACRGDECPEFCFAVRWAFGESIDCRECLAWSAWVRLDACDLDEYGRLRARRGAPPTAQDARSAAGAGAPAALPSI